jgi:integrase
VIQTFSPDRTVLWGFPLCGVRSDNQQLELLAPARPPITEGSRPKDIRDRAILLLLAVYALRSGEVRALRLEDLDWEKGLLFVSRTKGRKREPYPLSPTVGQAIIRYLREARL